MIAADVHQPPAIVRQDHRRPFTFVLMGQSNMAGYGEPGSMTPNRLVSAFQPSGVWRVASEPMPGGGGSGPALTFANAVVKATGRRVRIIQCAVPGTRIDRWVPGGDLYQACVRSFRESRVTVVDGFLYLQGESDAAVGNAAGWRSDFMRVLAGARRDFRPAAMVFAQIGGPPADTLAQDWRSMWGQQWRAHLQTGIPMIRTRDLPEKPGFPDFTKAGEREIGRRFAEAWLAEPT